MTYQRVVIVGERPSNRSKPYCGVHNPLTGAVGARIARLCGARYDKFLSRHNWYRENVYDRPGRSWNTLVARARAACLQSIQLSEHHKLEKTTLFVLLGRRVESAFCVSLDQNFYSPYLVYYDVYTINAVTVPHPSSRNRLWNSDEEWQRSARFWRTLWDHMEV